MSVDLLTTGEPATGSISMPFLSRRVPLMHCRHYVRNYFDLFEDLLGRIYSAGGVEDSVVVVPGDTIGDALQTNEQQVAVALEANDSQGKESVLLSLVRTIAEDQGAEPGEVDLVVGQIRTILLGATSPTFEDKADALEDWLIPLAEAGLIPEAQLDQMVGAFRSIGKLIKDVLAFEFPELKDLRVDLTSDPERYLLISGPYRAVLPADPTDVLALSFANDRITLEIEIDSITIDDSADFEFFRINEKKNGERVVKEKHELAMSAIGALVLDELRISLELDDDFGSPTVYPWAPGHEVRRAEWTQPSVEIHVDSVNLDLSANLATVTLSLLATFVDIGGIGGSFWGSVQELEEAYEELILDQINGLNEIAGIGNIAREYISPIAQRLIPVSHALSSVRYAAPYVGLPFPHELGEPDIQPLARIALPTMTQWEPESRVEFDKLQTIYETRAVSIRNEQPDAPEFESQPWEDDTFRWPDNLEDIDPVNGSWVWPAQAGGGFTQLDLNDLNHRAAAMAILDRVPDLPSRTHAIAALGIEGFPARTIGVLRQQDIDAGKKQVFGRDVGVRTLALLLDVRAEARANGAGEYLFRYGGFSGRSALVEAELRAAQLRVLRFAATGGLGSVPPTSRVIVSDFDPGIWTMDYVAETPLRTSRGTPGDPGWIGLSTNCVVATTLYRKLMEQNYFERQGVVPVPNGPDVSYDLDGCQDVAADFSGAGPDDAPALAIAGLKITVGTETEAAIEYAVDLRLRLAPIIHGRGCLPDDAVTLVSDSLECIETMTQGRIPENTRLRQLWFRDFIFLRGDFTDHERDIQIVNIKQSNGGTPTNAGREWIRQAIAHWFPGLPEAPILYNCFRPLGGENRNFFAENGWFCLYRRYPFRDFSDLDIG